MKHLVILIFAAFSFATSRAAEIHVAVTGNDTDPGTSAQPLATFAAAQARAKTLAGLEPVNVIFRAGTYYLADTIRFTAADSGTAANPVNYRAAAGATVTLSGGNSLAGLPWTTHSGAIRKTTVPAGMIIDQLFANQVKQNLARFPNYDPATRVFNGHAADAISTSRAANWANPAGGFFHALHSGEWGGFHYRITGKNASNVISYTGGQQNNRSSAPHGTYRFVENIFEELNAPGEWFYNAAISTLYFHPPAGTDPSTATMETAGRLKHLVQFDGTQAAPVKYVNLSGFIFRHAARTFMETYEPLLRSDWTIYRGAAVLLTGTEDCAISACEFEQLGGNAVFFSNYNRRSSVIESYFHDIGASGVCFVGNPSAVRDPLFNYNSPANSYSSIDKTNAGPLNDDYPADCLVENCLITGIGQVEKQPAGIQISMASRITVRHCSIYDCARSGINVGDGCWGGHIIEFCDTFDTVLETSDHGSFNSWGRDRFWNLSGATNAQLKAVSLLDTFQPIILRNSRWQCDHGWDIDLDDGSSNYLIENNLLLNRGLKLREGFYRTSRNNVILKSSLHPHVWYPDSGDIFEKNIVSSAYQPAIMPASPNKWGERLDFNLFPTEAMRTAFAANGCDANSLSGSPMFVSPANGNYQVSAGSPALTLGFVNFPMDRFGVTTRPFTVNTKSIDVRTPALISSAPPIKLTGVFRWLGSQVKAVTTIEEASSFGTNPANGGVFFKGAYLGSAAAATGLLETDLIASINGVATATVEDMVVALSAATGDVTFGIVRGQSPSSVTVPAASLTDAGILALESGVMTVRAAGISVDSFMLLGGLANGIGIITADNIELREGTVTVPLVSTGPLTKTANSTAIVAGGMTSTGGVNIATGTLKVDPTLSPPVKSGLILRLDASSADSLVATGSGIGRWLDADGSGVYAEQNTPSKSPFTLAAAQNGRPVMDFGNFNSSDTGRSMAFKSAQGETLDLTTIRTAFWVMQGSNHLLTSATTYDFHRAGETQTSAPWQSGLANGNVVNGLTYLNGTFVDGTTTALASGFNLISLVTIGNVSASTLCGDRTFRSGGQRIAEVILYNRALNSSERQNVETYLRHKWFAGPAPASNALAGADVATGATLDLAAGFTHSQGTLTLNGSALLNITGSLINQATIDIRSWSGTLPASLINQGTVLASGDGLAFTTQPGGGRAGAVWAAQPVVTLLDSNGNPKLGTTQNVTLSIQNNSGPGAVLNGTKTVAVNPANGRATFSGLSIDKPGTGYTLTATGDTVANLPGMVISGAFSVTASAVTPYVHYRMGDGTPATNGGGNLPYDSSGNGRHMANKAAGTPVITSSGGPTNDAYYTFAGSNQYFFGTTAAWNPPEDNVGVEAWVRTSNLSQMNRHVFGTGDNTKGLNLGFTAGGWFGAVAGKVGVGSTGSGNYTAGTWIHLAAVRSAGTTTFYANGYPMGSNTTVPNDATGTGILHMAVNSGGSSPFTGDIAEARIFTFAAGTFDPNTDLLVTPVPPQLVREETVPTTAGTSYLLRFRIKPGSGQSTAPRLRLNISGSAELGNHTLQNGLPSGATEVPYFFRFTADSATTTLRFSTMFGDTATAAQIDRIEVTQPLTATPSTMPNARQQAQIDRRYGLFLHFGVNTFNDLEWSNGTLPASSYQPTALDVDQWVQTAYEAGMRYVLIISKHHDGFCMWNSPWTNYDVGSSSVSTDVIAAAAAACQKYGIKLALYYSLWDRREPSYSNDTAYNQYMLRQLTELFENYGAIHELWLDGAWDKALNRWPSTEIYDLVRRLQPDCQVSTNWTIGLPNNLDQQVLPGNQQEGYPVRYFPSDFRLGDPYQPKFPDPKVFTNNGNSYYLPFESTVTLSSQNRWFYHTGDSTNKSLDELAALYYSATAQNNILVLNAPPDRSGKIRALERNTLFQLRDKLGLSSGVALPRNLTGTATGTASSVGENDTATFGPQRALDENPNTRWAAGSAGATSSSFEIDFGGVRNFNRMLIDEYEATPGAGRITSFRLQAWTNGDWSTFYTGNTCGRFSLHNFPHQSTSKIRLLIDSSTDVPSIWEMQIHQTDHAFTAWRDEQFAPFGNSRPAFALNGDPDGDGRTNQMEFALNDDPNNPAPSAKIAIRPSLDSALNEFVFTAPVRNGATFKGSTPPTAITDGITYQVQGSLDLGSFDAPLLEVFPSEAAGLPPLDLGWSYHSFRHATPGVYSGFFRMKTSPR
ncbi:MAG: alpha-L-fucosidase [Luteolibacter sp.]